MGMLDAAALAAQSALTLATLKLNADMAQASYEGAVQAAELKKAAILEGLWSMVEKQATATAKRASAAADIWNQM